LFKIINARPGKSITVDIRKPFNKSTTVDDNYVNVIDFFDQYIDKNQYHSSILLTENFAEY